MPSAIDRRLSKDFLTITTLERKTPLPPIPRTPYEKYNSTKLLANEATVKLSAQVRHPATDAARQPKRLIREPAKGPNSRQRLMDSDPIQAKTEMKLLVNNY